MPIMYEFSKYALVFDKDNIDPIDLYPDGAEQEHISSCDINKLVKNAANGIPVRGRTSPLVYGEDDTTLDAVQHRIKKQQVEKELSELAKNDLSDEDLQKIPNDIRTKFGFKAKKTIKKSNDDDKTTTKDTKSTSIPTSPANPANS